MKQEKKLKEKSKFYTLDKIKKEEAQYNVIFGERSNGKTFSVQEEIIKNYATKGKQGGIIRRYFEDFQGNNGQAMFEHMLNNDKGNLVEFYTKGEWNNIYYYSGRWYFCKYDEKNIRVRDEKPFAHAFALGGQEHYKSTSYPDITTILFDEFMTRGYYLADEFILFQNILSTIIRYRDDVTIYMLGNTVNKYSPYFKEMDIDISKMKVGDLKVIQFATYNDKVLKIAVHYADGVNDKPSDVYFAFRNPKLKMITSGMWEMALYPHLPYKYHNKNIIATYFIIWEQDILQCEIINEITNEYITYIHRKTTPIQNENKDIVYTTEFSSKPNYRRKLFKPIDKIDKVHIDFFKKEKVFYQDNEVGEIVRNYTQWCNTDRGFV